MSAAAALTLAALRLVRLEEHAAIVAVILLNNAAGGLVRFKTRERLRQAAVLAWSRLGAIPPRWLSCGSRGRRLAVLYNLIITILVILLVVRVGCLAPLLMAFDLIESNQAIAELARNTIASSSSTLVIAVLLVILVVSIAVHLVHRCKQVVALPCRRRRHRCLPSALSRRRLLYNLLHDLLLLLRFTLIIIIIVVAILHHITPPLPTATRPEQRRGRLPRAPRATGRRSRLGG